MARSVTPTCEAREESAEAATCAVQTETASALARSAGRILVQHRHVGLSHSAMLFSLANCETYAEPIAAGGIA
jgi:hypothetical protein